MKTLLAYSLLLLLAGSRAAAQQPVVVARSTQIMTDGNHRYYVHQVKKGETMYSICRAYGVTEDELRRDNPDISGNTIKVDMWLKVFLAPDSPAPTAEAPGQPAASSAVTLLKHEVKRRETLYSISVMYEVEIDHIKQYNPQVFADGDGKIKTKQQLLIPISLSGLRRGSTAWRDAALHEQCDSSAHRMTLINVALLLPFDADRQDDARELYRSFRFLEVYEGALLALENLRRQGLSVNLSVLDTKSTSLSALLRHPSLASADLIIGPVYQDLFKPLAEFAGQRGIKIVSPLVPIDSSLYGHSHVFQVPVDFEWQVQQALVHDRLDPYESNIILVSQRDGDGGKNLRSYYRQYLPKADSVVHRNTPGVRDSLEWDRLQRQYETHRHLPVVKNLSYKIGLQPRENQEVFLRVFSAQLENKVVVASQDEPFVSELLANLKAFADRYKCRITIYGTNAWKKFDNVELRLFYDLKLHMATPDYISYKSPDVKQFVQRYREAYKTEPSQFAFRGYDVMLYFASAMQQYGKNFAPCLPLHRVPLLQSSYSFAPVYPGGAYENKGVFLLRYTPWMDILQYQ